MVKKLFQGSISVYRAKQSIPKTRVWKAVKGVYGIFLKFKKMPHFLPKTLCVQKYMVKCSHYLKYLINISKKRNFSTILTPFFQLDRTSVHGSDGGRADVILKPRKFFKSKKCHFFPTSSTNFISRLLSELILISISIEL